MINPKRPNTGVENSLLSEKVIVCCGEDAGELLWALRIECQSAETLYHEYRCYRFWKYNEFTLVWTGIGTGCLEPLLFELFDSSCIKQVILIGTSGCIQGKDVNPGDVFLVEKAFLGGAAIHLPDNALPLTYRFDDNKLANLNLERKTSISTDFYYGFAISPDSRIQRLQAEDLNLKNDLSAYWDKAQVVDMEIGQFYHLCKIFGASNLEYIAVKGAANATDNVSQQTEYSRQILQKALQNALKLLEVNYLGGAIPASTVTVSAENTGNIAKLNEEIKMYWTIQLAVCAVLGYLGSNLNFILKGTVTANDTKNFIISLIAFLLISIGSIYNLVGNYYIRLCGYSIEGAEQEDIISPSLAVAYLIISGIIGSVIAYSFVNIFAQNNSSNKISMFSGLVLGFCLNYRYGQFVLKELCKRDLKKRYSGVYSQKLKWIYQYTPPESDIS